MNLILIASLGLGLLLGIKHAFDADHLIAVSAFLRKASHPRSALKMGLYWALGHMITASVITLLLYTLKESLLRETLGYFEKITGILLMLLGLWTLKDLFLKTHEHPHSHGPLEHSHPHSHLKWSSSLFSVFGLGIFHGLASNDEILMLLTVSLGANTLFQVLGGLGFFGLGVILGMVFFSWILGSLFLKTKHTKIYPLLTLSSGGLGAIYGILMIAR